MLKIHIKQLQHYLANTFPGTFVVIAFDFILKIHAGKSFVSRGCLDNGPHTIDREKVNSVCEGLFCLLG